MKTSLRVLHVEDSKADCELVGHLLSSDGIVCETKRVETRTQLFDALQNEAFDLILSDCSLPGFSGLKALEIAHALKPEVPFIFVSGTIGEEAAIESLRNGATDYVLKDRLTRLAPAVRRAVGEAEEHALCREMRQRLSQMERMEAISTLSNGIAHDFNNILTIILGHASLIATEYKNPERVVEIAETITEAGRRASEIVEQLLAFARKSEGHVVPTDLNRFIQENLARLKAKVPATIEIGFEPGSGLPNILADPYQMERILANLLANSVESMSGGGRITLSTRGASARELRELPDTPGKSSYVCLQVADTGMGMEEMTLKHVFEPFYTTKERGHATGLGLPVVYGLMRSQNGSVRVESEPGKGTTVALYFPQQPLVSAKAPPKVAGLDPALRGSETILVVEDEPEVSFFLEAILTKNGYHVLIAHDANEALRQFDEHREEVALVFSDIGLPKVDGITLCTKLRMLRPDLRVILASGYSPKEFKARMDDLGSKAFLFKPYNMQDILQCVRTVLDGRECASGSFGTTDLFQNSSH